MTRGRRTGQRSRTVREDWSAWIPNEMDRLFDDTRHELESSNFILSISLDEALSLCKGGQRDTARDRVTIISGLFERLIGRVQHVINTIRDHGVHFGTLPNVTPLSPANFRGVAAQRIAFMDSLLARVLFRERTRFFHKLQALEEIIGELQTEARAVLAEIAEGISQFPDHAFELLEVLGYDLNTCMGETTIVLKSFFCALPPEELESFRRKLMSLAQPLAPADEESIPPCNDDE